MIFGNIYEPTSTNFIFGQFSVARKLIINGGAIRPAGLLLGFGFGFIKSLTSTTHSRLN